MTAMGIIQEVGPLTFAYTDYYGELEGFQELDRFFDSIGRMIGIGEEGFAKTVNGSQVTYDVHGQSWDTSFTFDAEKNTLLFSDYDAYTTLMCGALGDITRATNEGMPKGYQMKPGTFSYVSGGECLFDFGAYDIDILQNEEGDIFMPCPLFSSIFLPVLSIIGGFNGNGYYIFSAYTDLFDMSTGELSEFGKAYYDSPFKDLEAIPERIAALHGNESMFLFDHFYGFGDSERFEGMKISEYLEEHYPERYEAFYGTDPEALDSAWDWTLNNFLGDGHTGNYAHAGSYYSSTDYELKEGMSERREKIYAASAKYTALREEKLGIPADSALSAENMFQIEGDMAVIRFDQFLYGFTAEDDQSEDFYKQYMALDGYCLFAYSFLQIEKDPPSRKWSSISPTTSAGR